jgi:Xaa-Pro aminopeptidase
MIRYKNISSKLFIQNRTALYQKAGKEGIYIFVSSPNYIRNGDQYYPFRQNSDTFYFSGLDQENIIIMLCPAHPKADMREIALIVEPDEKTFIWQGHKYSPEEVTAVSGIKTVKYIHEFENIFLELSNFSHKVLMPFSFNERIDSNIPRPTIRLQEKLKDIKSGIIFQDITDKINELRIIKSTIELDVIKTACKITKTAFLSVLNNLKPEMYEYQVEAVINHDFIFNGASGHAYAPIVASGKNACVLHYNTNHDICKNGDLLLLDFGAEYANYAADCSRTIPINGKYSKRQLQVYNAVLTVFKEIKKHFVPDNTVNGINELTNNLIEEQLISLGLISKEDIKNQDANNPIYKIYFPHGTSHFMGLDVHDVGGKDVAFEKGMVLTCEPGIYIPSENIGVRIENDIVVAETPIDLMEDIPIEPKEIEELMNK